MAKTKLTGRAVPGSTDKRKAANRANAVIQTSEFSNGHRAVIISKPINLTPRGVKASGWSGEGRG